ncbi:unnamed protein product [Linum tenue]|uniref:beta-aspartyl-peptidase n=1 Tax=Linum tenue TaxID=586396 RepID=A0AAV0MM23_9ROSI|nr:unnamed protein product [Linum tenue]
MAAPATFHAHFPLTAASLARPLSATASNSASPLSNPTPTLSTSSNSWYAQITPRISSGHRKVRELENHPQFNAGKGSVLTTDGTVEMEACIMDGKTMRCGAVSGLTTVVNAVSVARLVMDKTPHIYLGFQGAEAFAREHVSPSNFALLLIHNLHSIDILCLSATLNLDFIAKAACCYP